MKEDDGVPVKRNYIAKGGWLTYGQRDSLTKLQTSGCNCVPLMMVIKKRDGISASFCSSLSSCGSLLHVVFMFILLFPQVKKNSSKGIHSFSAARGVDGTRLAWCYCRTFVINFNSGRTSRRNMECIAWKNYVHHTAVRRLRTRLTYHLICNFWNNFSCSFVELLSLICCADTQIIIWWHFFILFCRCFTISL